MGRNILDNKNGLERYPYHHNIISSDIGGHPHFNWKGFIKRLITPNKKMEAKLIVILACIVGYPSFILGIAANMGWIIIGNWQATVLFWLGAIFFMIKIVVYCIKQYQAIRKAEDDWKRQQRKRDDEIFS